MCKHNSDTEYGRVGLESNLQQTTIVSFWTRVIKYHIV